MESFGENTLAAIMEFDVLNNKSDNKLSQKHLGVQSSGRILRSTFKVRNTSQNGKENSSTKSDSNLSRVDYLEESVNSAITSIKKKSAKSSKSDVRSDTAKSKTKTFMKYKSDLHINTRSLSNTRKLINKTKSCEFSDIGKYFDGTDLHFSKFENCSDVLQRECSKKNIPLDIITTQITSAKNIKNALDTVYESNKDDDINNTTLMTEEHVDFINTSSNSFLDFEEDNALNIPLDSQHLKYLGTESFHLKLEEAEPLKDKTHSILNSEDDIFEDSFQDKEEVHQFSAGIDDIDWNTENVSFTDEAARSVYNKKVDLIEISCESSRIRDRDYKTIKASGTDNKVISKENEFARTQFSVRNDNVVGAMETFEPRYTPASQALYKICKSNISENNLEHSQTVKNLVNKSKASIKSYNSISVCKNISLNSTSFKHTSSISTSGALLNFNQKLVLKNWGLPETILTEYANRGVTTMFEWQVECLGSPNVLEQDANLVYSAPTSAGKTLVAEILTIKTVLERNKKVIIILPFVSVVREKMFYFQDILGSSGVRVSGFMGSHSPPGGINATHVAVCTIEKANSLINRMLEEGSLSEIGAIVVDELHLLGDPGRGYILELLLTKIRYMSKMSPTISIQIIGMSATLPNLDLLASWLNAELYKTDFRPIPLIEQCKIDKVIYDNKLNIRRDFTPDENFPRDPDNIIQLCIETISQSCSVLIFCPTKNWCENLSQQISTAFMQLGKSTHALGVFLRDQLNGNAIKEVLEQLRNSPAGLDGILGKAISYGAAYHHAGLTMDERDIIEGGFKNGAIRVLVATSTLSSGVNLPARRVIIRSPIFHGKPLNTLTYRQMIGRAGRMGKDTRGESILICSKNDARIAKELMSTNLDPIESCLEGDGKLKRAVLEVIASGVAVTPAEIEIFANCTLLAASDTAVRLDSKSSQNDGRNSSILQSPIQDTVKFLIEFELIRLQESDVGQKYVASPLGRACLTSSMPPEDGLTLFTELQRARQCFVLETELHTIYLVTPYSVSSQWGNLDWFHVLELWEQLPASMRRVGELVGVQESFIVRAVRGTLTLNTAKLVHKMQIHRRFYTALALQELVNEVPLGVVASKYKCSRGVLQSLQQSASTFAGMVTIFTRQLGWTSVEILVSQFQDRLQFGIQRDLIDLMRLPLLNGQRARAIFNSGIESLVQLASADICVLENALHSAIPFQSEKNREDECEYDTNARNTLKSVWVTGKKGLTPREAAELLVDDARKYLEIEMGLSGVNWGGRHKTLGSQTEVHSDSKSEVKVIEKERKLPTPEKSSCAVNLGVIDLEKDPVSSRTRKRLSNSKYSTSECENSNDLIIPKLKLSHDNMQNLDVKSNSEIATGISSLPSDISFQSDELRRCEDDISENISYNCYLKPNQSFDEKKGTINENIVKLLSSENISKVVSNITPCNEMCITKRIRRSGSGKYSDNLFDESIDLDSNICGILDSPRDKSNKPKIQVNNINFVNDVESTALSTFMNEGEVPNISNTLHEGTTIHSVSKHLDDDELVAGSQDSSLNTAQSFKKMIKTQRTLKRLKSVDDVGNVCTNNSKTKTEICKSKKKRLLNKELTDNPDGNRYVEIVNDINFESKKILRKHNNTVVKSKTNLDTCEIPNQVGIVNATCDIETFKSFQNMVESESDISIAIRREKNIIVKPAIGCKIIETPANARKKNNVQSKVKNCLINDYYISEISIYFGGKFVYVINLQDEDDNCKISVSDKISFLKHFFSMKNKILRVCDSKDQYKLLFLGCDLVIDCKIEDPKIADWLLQPDEVSYKLEEMALKYCPRVLELVKSISNLSAREALITWYLIAEQRKRLLETNSTMLETFCKTEMLSITCLARSELNGMGLNVSDMNSLSNDIKKQMSDIENEAFKLAGRKFVMSSTKDVAKVLGMYKGRKVCTNKQVLEGMDNPISPLILLWRKLNCTLTKVVFPILRVVLDSNRIYAHCITHTLTGRITMAEPNIQNVPRDFSVRDGKDILSCRSVFKANKGFVIVSADYCQLELRILTHFCQDKILCSIMKTGKDVFKAIAAKWNKIKEDQVDDNLRQRTKQLIYGMIYGMGTKSLAETLNVTELEAASFLETFHNAYPGIKSFINHTISKCRSTGYIETINGRRRYLPNINQINAGLKGQAERQAINTTIQGSAADITKTAMALVDQNIKSYLPSVNMILTPDNSRNKLRRGSDFGIYLVLHLHDELIYEVSEKYVDNFSKILRHSMENAILLTVPLPVKVKAGESWGKLREI